MQFCMPHWTTLRENVIKEGLGDWIAKDGEVAIDQMVDQVSSGSLTVANYDPLMSCHNMIMSRTIEMVGLYCMTEEFGCPICYFNSKRTEDGRCACDEEDCAAKAPGSIPPFESWLEQTPAACKEYMAAQGWL